MQLNRTNNPRSTNSPPIRVLVDVSHGYEIFIPAKVSAMGAFLEGTGEFEITTLIWQEINSSVLTDIDILIIMHPDPSIPYSSDEIQAVLDFWNNGGSILFVGGINSGEVRFDNSEVNRIMEEMSIDISFRNEYVLRSDISVGFNCSLASHPITSNVQSIYQRATKINVGDTTPTTVIATDKTGNPNFVTWEEDSQRAVFLGSQDLLKEKLHTTWQTDKNYNHPTQKYQLMYNIFNWLSNTPIKEVSLSSIYPLRMYTEYENNITSDELGNYSMFKGIVHTHTSESAGHSVPYDQYTANALTLGIDFILVTDYNTISGGPELRKYVQENDIPISVLDGIEVTGLGGYHTTGWNLSSAIRV